MDNTDVTLSNALEILPAIFAHDFLRYFLIVGAVFVIVNGLLSRALTRRVIRDRDIPKGQKRRELLASFRTVLVFTGIGMTMWAGTTLGILKFYENPAQHGWLWFWISALLLIGLHDTWFYWTHRLIHHPRLYRRFHRLHHKSKNPTPFAAYAFDTEEAVINGVYVLVFGLIIPSSFLAGLIFTVHMTLRNAIGHSGYEIFPARKNGRPLFDWMTSVTHHDMHHEYARGHYGLYFTFWDRVMGTERADYHDRFAKSVGKTLTSPKQRSNTAALPMVLGAMLIVGSLGWADKAAANEPTSVNLPPSNPMTEIVGAWATEGYGAVVLMKRCEGAPTTLCGDLLWVWDPEEIKPGAMGNLMLWQGNFRDGKWRDVRLKNPEDGRTFKGKITQRSHDLLDLKGCAGPFCKTQTWRRLGSIPHLPEDLKVD